VPPVPLRRRLVLAAGAAACAAILAAGSPAAPAPGLGRAAAALSRAAPAPRTPAEGSDWPRFRGPRGDGRSPETGLLEPWPEGGPPVLWTAKIGRGYSQVAVADGRLFAIDRRGDQVRLHCLRPETGEELWRSEYTTGYEGFIEKKGGPMATPVVDGDRVYTFGPEGRLRCHRVTDGELIWEVDTAARFGVVQNAYGAGSTPWIEGDLLIAIIGGSPPDSPGFDSDELRGNGSGVLAFDKRTGEVRYRLSDELASYASPLVAELGGRRTGLAFTRGGLLLFDPLRGEQRGFFPWFDRSGRGVNAAMPVVAGDTVFITEAYGPGGALLEIGAEGEPEVVWQDSERSDRSLAAHWSTPLYHRGHLFGLHGRAPGEIELRAVDHATGEVRWSHRIGQLASLLYFDQRILVVTERGRLLLVSADPRRFEALEEVDLGTAAGDGDPLLAYPVWNAPVLSRGLLYVRGWARLVCFDLRAGGRPEPTAAH
jgi:outer membrane protein assembly factor BamB